MLRQPRLFNPLVVVLGCIIVSLLTTFAIVEKNLRPTIQAISKAQAEQIAVESIQDAVNEKVAKVVEYKDLIFVRTDSRGRVVLMQPNTVKINSLAADTTLEVQKALKKLEGKVFKIPLGQTLGSQLLASYGPKIKVTIVPIGTVKVIVEDKFEQAGINQTRHRLYLNIFSKVKIVIPLVSDSVEVSSQVPIAETIIVGEVPGTYLNLTLGKGLELIGK
ncbi:sporulation protein YunB [Thermincola potens]|uniref:Sporulation protein YunB n=1 Tax=Thermincola potens (strain JR) TaxID=635013 RepID=D5X8T8_THEPJ|nr:sporulation protein YunB [Thermincola potens]ADG82964.1 sporulation protein YunB [Thermincola potens JR]